MLGIAFDNGTSTGELLFRSGRLQSGDPLETAVLISLFSDSRAKEADSHDGDPRGWWADTPESAIGSRLWLLRRSKASAETLERAREYAEEALAWLVEDGVASAVHVTTERSGQTLLLGVTVQRPDGAGPWSRWWEVTNAL